MSADAGREATMANRRRFLGGAVGLALGGAGVPAVARAGRDIGSLCPDCSVTVAQGYRPLGDDASFTQMEIRIRAFGSEEGAERERRLTLRAPVMEFLGEIYPGNPREMEIPEDLARLPGNVVHYDVIAGAAGARSTQLMGAFRIGSLMWMIDAANADLALVVRLAEGISARVQAAKPGSITRRSGLRALLPDAGAFGEPVELVDPEDFLFRYRL